MCGIDTNNCLIVFSFIVTNSIQPVNYQKFRVFMGHYPAGSSQKCVNHYH